MAGIDHRTLLSGIGAAMIGVLWAYEGWQYVTFSAGETRDPQRTFPRGDLDRDRGARRALRAREPRLSSRRSGRRRSPRAIASPPMRAIAVFGPVAGASWGC